MDNTYAGHMRDICGRTSPGAGGKSPAMGTLCVSNEAIEPVAQRIKDRLAALPGVSDIEDNAPPGRMEMQVGDKVGASTLGISLQVGTVLLLVAAEEESMGKVPMPRQPRAAGYRRGLRAHLTSPNGGEYGAVAGRPGRFRQAPTSYGKLRQGGDGQPRGLLLRT